jgi:4-azaleucine resistance transporter AzlC
MTPSTVRGAEFVEGFVAMLPLWSGAIPSGIAYGVAARAVGMSAFDTQLMSLIVFSAAGQITAISLIDAGSTLAATLVTVLAVNAQLPLLGIAAARQLRPSGMKRLQLATMLTDAAFGIAATREPFRHHVLVGAGFSMYLGWNLGTAVGLAAGNAFGDPSRIGLDFVVTLSFLAVLVPLVRSRAAAVAVFVSAAIALLMLQFTPVGVALLAAGAGGAFAGAMAANIDAPDRRSRLEQGDA